MVWICVSCSDAMPSGRCPVMWRVTRVVGPVNVLQGARHCVAAVVSSLPVQSSMRRKNAAVWSGARLMKGHVAHKEESSKLVFVSRTGKARDKRRIAAAAVLVE